MLNNAVVNRVLHYRLFMDRIIRALHTSLQLLLLKTHNHESGHQAAQVASPAVVLRGASSSTVTPARAFSNRAATTVGPRRKVT